MYVLFSFIQIKKFKLEVALFARELNFYIENVNEMDDEATKLLIETILSVNKLQINSKFRDVSSSNESDFVHNLNGDVFESRRYIVCRLCSVNIVFFISSNGIFQNIRLHVYFSGTNSIEYGRLS